MSNDIVIETHDRDGVPADVLLRLLSGTQQLALLLGAAQEKQSLEKRFRPSEEIRSRYQLRVGVTQKGSYVVPVWVENQDGVFEFAWEDPTPKIALLIELAGREAWDDFNRIFPAVEYAKRAMQALKEMAPKAGEAWHAVWRTAGKQLAIDDRLGRKLKTRLDMQPYTTRPLTITGKLITAKFSQNSAEIRIPKIDRTLEFAYPADVEELLVEWRREWVQITGAFDVDENLNPVKVIDVTTVDGLDLSALRLESVEWGGVKLRAIEPLTLATKLDEEFNQYLEVEDPYIDLIACGRTRDELADAVAREIVMAWNLYAKEDEDRLTSEARELAHRLRSRFSEVLDADKATRG